MWRGSLSFEPPMLWAAGFLVTFLFGGLTGVLLASPPIDFHVTDSYFVVAHFHYVLFGTIVFAMFAGFSFWWPKMTGTMLDTRLEKVHFWTLFVGFHTTFLVQHWLEQGMPRRYADYLAARRLHRPQHHLLHRSLPPLGLSTPPFLYNVWKTAQHGKRIEVDDPGATDARWSGPPPARPGAPQLRHSCPGSAPSPPASTCTTPRSPTSTRRRTPDNATRSTRAAARRPEMTDGHLRWSGLRCRPGHRGGGGRLPPGPGTPASRTPGGAGALRRPPLADHRAGGGSHPALCRPPSPPLPPDVRGDPAPCRRAGPGVRGPVPAGSDATCSERHGVWASCLLVCAAAVSGALCTVAR